MSVQNFISAAKIFADVMLQISHTALEADVRLKSIINESVGTVICLFTVIMFIYGGIDGVNP